MAEGSRRQVFAAGERLDKNSDLVEDYAVGMIDLAGGAVVHRACSWKLRAGRDAEVAAAFQGTRGERCLFEYGRLVSYKDALAERFDPEIERVCSVAASSTTCMNPGS